MWASESVPIIVALIALAGTVINAWLGQKKMPREESFSKEDAVKLEHRLTAIEGKHELTQKDITHIKEHMFSKTDRDCLIALNERVGTIYNALGTLIPKNLKNPPYMDGILDAVSNKVNEVGWFGAIDYIKKEMPDQDRSQLLTYLETQSASKNMQRRIWAGLFLNLIKAELNLLEKDPALCILEA